MIFEDLWDTEDWKFSFAITIKLFIDWLIERDFFGKHKKNKLTDPKHLIG